ncbi:FAD-dependent oxidoreductase [Actinokineospora diospyrosa]|uniref:Pyruvate/2-oxoglutarate dehydrogenase complex, dihydrolipoamide dehydrogenase (E3) component n=1 Tax=Actinokineospora diospyrosa TaxID=103728 RepID=A0ABT1IDC0_9PSEU|nr:FAD-dependent oxidoreductase [Actinokineospora diospyrosa]MCP2270630.1 Pyruvate/2-oxoglutarate dehydrogenase complex, dihydrolipoamide dehydrogenase (E3) component [Actinokineospora diospyrosa]
MRVVVIGGGPAGVAAAEAAVRAGADTVLVDSEPTLGGQFHRGNPQRVDSRVRHLANSTVWAVQGLRLHIRTGPADSPTRTGEAIDADAVVIATGAHDRVVPFPGWDLPGVYTAGAAQALAKGQGIAIGQRVLVSGTGPFLLPVAESLKHVGANVLGICDANTGAGWLRHPRAANPTKIAELLGYAIRLRTSWQPRTAVVAAHGDDKVSAVTVAKLNPDWTIRSQRRVAVDAVCVGHGFTPRLELAVSAGCKLADGFIAVDHTGATSVPGWYAAGEVTGIGGADLAAAEGEVAGTAAAGGPCPATALAKVRSGRRFAAALAAAHPIRPGWQTWLADDTLVCRCEEVTYRALREAIDLDATGTRTFKLTSRVGLGLCQGRMCGRSAVDLATTLAAQRRTFFTPADLQRRPIATPLRLAELASLPEEDL